MNTHGQGEDQSVLDETLAAEPGDAAHVIAPSGTGASATRWSSEPSSGQESASDAERVGPALISLPRGDGQGDDGIASRGLGRVTGVGPTVFHHRRERGRELGACRRASTVAAGSAAGLAVACPCPRPCSHPALVGPSRGAIVIRVGDRAPGELTRASSSIRKSPLSRSIGSRRSWPMESKSTATAGLGARVRARSAEEVGTRPRSSRTIGRTSKMRTSWWPRACAGPSPIELVDLAERQRRVRGHEPLHDLRLEDDVGQALGRARRIARAISRRRSSCPVRTRRETVGGMTTDRRRRPLRSCGPPAADCGVGMGSPIHGGHGVGVGRRSTSRWRARARRLPRGRRPAIPSGRPAS